MDFAKIRRQLMHKRSEIFARVNRLSGDLHARGEPYSAAADERAVELENQDVLYQIDAASRSELNMINAALERLDNGNYGICIGCGKPIDTLRLGALPYAENCFDCLPLR